MFKPSVNIIRDTPEALNFLVTPNAARVYQIIKDNFLFGNRAFSLIGTYGTGKSSFLLALEKHLSDTSGIFESSFSADDQFDFIKILGGYDSLISTVAKEINATDVTEKSILDRLSETKGEKNRVFILDEFGKFLEYAGEHAPERELYFIQLLAEYASEPSNQLIFITTLHQGFDAYATGLNQRQRNEWEKVKGRFTEIPFNEPVEQLIHIASDRIPSLIPKKSFSNLSLSLSLAEKKNILKFRLNDRDRLAIPRKLLPLDIISVFVLAKAIQEFGQNERSLFSFLESANHLGLKEFLEEGKGEMYDLVQVYDYLAFNFYSAINSRFNPHLIRWNHIEESIDQIEARLLPSMVEPAIQLVKVIGLLHIYANKGAFIDQEFLSQYLQKTRGLQDIDPILKELERKQIILFQRFRDSFVLFEGSNIDFPALIRECEDDVEVPENLVSRLTEYFNLSPLLAKAYLIRKGTPRYFKFEISEEPILSLSKKESNYDGYINVVINDKFEISNHQEPILYAYLDEVSELRRLIKEIDVYTLALKKVKAVEDSVAEREFSLMKSDAIKRLNEKLSESITQNPKDVKWYFQGEKITSIESSSKLNRFLSHICEVTYSSAPNFLNELVNRNKLSAAVSTARKKLIRAFIQNENLADLGFDSHRFPAEKSIYLSLLKGNLHVELDEGKFGAASSPVKDSFNPLWESGESFLEKAQDQILPVSDLVDTWRSQPFRLKNGFIDFWLPIFLYIKREEYTLYDENQFLIPRINDDVLELLVNKPSKFFIKSFSIAGQRLTIFNKYRELTSQGSKDAMSQTGFLDTIKPFLVFYKQLPPFSQQTKRISKDAMNFRKALVKAKDPEKVFFEDLPLAFGYSLSELETSEEHLNLFIERIRDSIRELNEAYSQLIFRVEAEIKRLRGIGENIAYEDYRSEILNQLNSVKQHLLSPSQKAFYGRLLAPMDSATDWISALGQVILKKGLDKLKDSEEKFFLEKLGDAFRALDNVRDFAKFDSVGEQEEVLKLEITSLRKGFDYKVFSNLAKVNPEKTEATKRDIQSKLSGEKEIDLAVLSDLLKELLSENGEE